jgi:7,8-dihydro-6-hydroxymethylpterin-pyrophosphokinase
MVYGSILKTKDLTASSFSNLYPTTENKGIQSNQNRYLNFFCCYKTMLSKYEKALINKLLSIEIERTKINK